MSRPRHISSPRSAFTLVEMLLVLALVVVLAGLSWPALRGPLASHRLREAGRTLRSELAKARLAALEQGTELEFRYLVDSERFRIGPALGVFEDADASLGSFETRMTNESKTTDTNESRGPGYTEFTLPDGIVFVEGFGEEDESKLQMSAADMALEAEASAGTDGERWSLPIVLHPDGTATSARFKLSNNDGLAIVVALRGLTGTTTLGDPESDEDEEFP